MAELPERLGDNVSLTHRPRNPGAEKWLLRPVDCLDKGFVYLVDYLGNDEAIARAARVSLGNADQRDLATDRKLIRYLMAHRHTSPFEMAEVKFHCKLPIFVARQWIRHRTANVNEQSGRYSVLDNGDYLPDPAQLRRQSKTNKQGRDQELGVAEQGLVLNILRSGYENQNRRYHRLLDDFDLARELARINLTVATYTQWYWKIDLHNLLHFLKLRLDAHAQYEIRVYAEAMAMVIKDAFPLAWEAFDDYQLRALTLSRPEVEMLMAILQPMKAFVPTFVSEQTLKEMTEKRFPKDQCWQGEGSELLEKLKKIGLM